jgi:hypothetical protein
MPLFYSIKPSLSKSIILMVYGLQIMKIDLNSIAKVEKEKYKYF